MKWLFITLGILISLFILLSAPGLLLFPGVLVWGWVPAAKRLATSSAFTGSELFLFFGASALLFVGIHWFFRQHTRWKWRWTAGLMGTVALVLLSIMCAVGIAHQFGWILLSSEPVFVNRRTGWIRERADLMNTAAALWKLTPTNASPGDAAALLRDGRLPDTHDGRRPWEKYYVRSNDDGFVVLQRKPSSRGLLAAVVDAQGHVSIDYDFTAATHAKQSY